MTIPSISRAVWSLRRYEGDVEQLGSRSGTTLRAGNREQVGDCVTHIIRYI